MRPSAFQREKCRPVQNEHTHGPDCKDIESSDEEEEHKSRSHTDGESVHGDGAGRDSGGESTNDEQESDGSAAGRLSAPSAWELTSTARSSLMIPSDLRQ
ncbi:hypothetical protein Gpo141_00013219 [Globisporangium polare]